LFASALQRLDAQERAETVVIGFSTEDTEVDRARRLEGLVREALTPLEGVECLEYADPAPYYRRALFFVLPADVVFGNFALLEAMAAGVVPVVFAADGVPQLVEHGVNGYVLDPGGDSLYAGLKIALDTAASDWQVMSRRAHETVQTKHSVENWARELVGLYERLPERRFWREREGVA
jgi:glycosyltransferase involved in cell wall biosynthesis